MQILHPRSGFDSRMPTKKEFFDLVRKNPCPHKRIYVRDIGMAGKVMIVEDTGRDDDPRSRCSLIGSDVGVYIFILMYYIEDIPWGVMIQHW